MAEGILVIHVASPQHRPIPGVQLGTMGEGSTGPPTDVAGKTRIQLAPQTRPGNWVSLQVVGTPESQDLVFVSPWDARAIVPPFENEADNFVPIVLAERGDRALLEYPKVLAERINAANAPKSVTEKVMEEERRSVLEKVSREYGLEPDEIDHAIRAWGRKTKDLYEKGVVALYAENYGEASRQLSESLDLRERELKKAQERVVEASFFLGQSLYEEGRYREAADAYRKAATLREDDPVILNALGLSLTQGGRYPEAEPLFKRSLEIVEKVLGRKHPDVATALNNLAGLYRVQGRYSEAEPLQKRALEIRKKVLGSEHPRVATALSNLAELYGGQGRYSEAEPLQKRALEIREKVLGPKHPHVAASLNNLAGLYYDQGKYTEAEPLFKRSLEIVEKVLGRKHPDVAQSLNNLAELYRVQGRHSEAEPLQKRALEIREKVLGPKHPDVAQSLNNLARLYYDQGKYTEAESLYRRSLEIVEKVLGPEHPYVAIVCENLAILNRVIGKKDEAEKFEARARKIRSKW